MSTGRELYRADGLPVFQNRTYSTQAEGIGCPKGDVRLVEDAETGLISNHAFDPARLAYDSDYQNEQAHSPTFRGHLDDVVLIVARHMGRSNLVEIGCGKGFFLEMLLAREFAVTGFDPAYEGENPQVRKELFAGQAGLAADGIILRHVLEHIQDPVGFLHHLRDVNRGRGLVYIEVPCFEWICERRAWFDVFYEHVNYFRPADFTRMFDRVLEQGHLFGGQYLYVVADLASIRPARAEPHDRAALPDDFLRTLHVKVPAPAGRCAVWGAASKGVIFALRRQRIGEPVTTVIDINPAKQGRYLPATGLLVEAPESAIARLPPGSPVFVMNSNYLREIQEMSSHRFNYVVIDHA